MKTHLWNAAAELQDDDRFDPHDAETPDPCRGCGRPDCDSECAAYRQWLTVAYLDWDAAERPSACDWCGRSECTGYCAAFKEGVA